MTTLRRRLIASHLIPILIITPLIGVGLVFFLERQVILANLATQLTRQAMLLAEMSVESPEVWTEPASAAAFTRRFSRQMTASLMLLDGEGRVLAASNPADQPLVGQPFDHSGVDVALGGQTEVHTDRDGFGRDEVADVLLPVFTVEGELLGLVRVYQVAANVTERFRRLRTIILNVLVGGSLVGAAAGLLLAITLERPLVHLTRSIYQLAHGEQLQPLPENGPAELRLLARAFNTLVERLQILRRARRQLLSNLVHEIGRPLGALQSANDALIHEVDGDAAVAQELLGGMANELRRLQGLLDNLVRFYDQALGALEIDLHPLDLASWLPAVVTPWGTAAREKQLAWQVEVPAGLPPVPADSDRLAQALGNLLSNAIKYTPAGGTVLVEAGATEQFAWIRVGDSGQGIAPDEQAIIFEPFYRSREQRRQSEGMGLGLSIARDLVLAHGGRLELDSDVGRGSRFTIWLPLGG